MRANDNIVFNGVVLVLLVAAIVMGKGYLPQAKLFPLVIGIPTLGLMIAYVYNDFVRNRKQVITSGKESEQTGAPNITFRQELTIIGWIVGFAFSVWLFGFTVSIPVILFAMERFLFRESVVTSLALALGVGIALYISFGVLLKIPLNCGILLSL